MTKSRSSSLPDASTLRLVLEAVSGKRTVSKAGDSSDEGEFSESDIESLPAEARILYQQLESIRLQIMQSDRSREIQRVVLDDDFLGDDAVGGPPNPSDRSGDTDPSRECGEFDVARLLQTAEQRFLHRKTPKNQPDDQLLGRHLSVYRIDELITRGGAGDVYRASHQVLNSDVAIKVMPRVNDRNRIKRYRREIRAAGMVNHPNVVRATDAGCDGGRFFLVMEWIDGLNTAQLVDRLGRMTVADACQIAFQAALGLQSLHNQDLIHRDVKPSNLMLSAGGTVRLLDLGLARMGESHQVSSILTPAGSLLGSLDFMAPEQADDPSNVGPPADIYSLGACLYHFLSGRSVLGLDESAGYLEKIAKLSLTGPARLSTKNQQIPRQLAELVDGMLVPAVSNRNVDLDAICQVLQRFAEESDLPQLLHRARNPSPSTGGVDLSSNPNPGAEPDQGSRETRDFPQFHSTPEHVPDETPDERTNDWIDRVRSAIKRFRSQNR